MFSLPQPSFSSRWSSSSLGSDPEISPSIFVKVDPYFGLGWPLAAGRGLTRDGYIWAPRESRPRRGGAIIGGGIGARKQKHGGTGNERGRGRKLADESRSGSCRGKVVVRDQPSVAAAIVHFFLSLPPFYFLFSPVFSSFRALLCRSPPLPDRILLALSSSSSSFPIFAHRASLDVGSLLPAKSVT